MIKFFKKIFGAKVTCIPDSDSEINLESEDSSIIEYDDVTTVDTRIQRSWGLDNKLNLVYKLKAALSDFLKGEKMALYTALQMIDEIGFYPPGMPISKSDLLTHTKNYEYSFNKNGYPIAHYHIFWQENRADKFELWVKSPILFSEFYPNQQDETGQTLLHHAVRWNNYKLAEILLNLDFNPNELDFSGKPPIFSTLGHLHHDTRMAELLLKYEADPYIRVGGKTLLEKALKKNYELAELIKSFNDSI